MNNASDGKKEAIDKTLQSIQESFLNSIRREKSLVTIYLISGVKLSGRIRSFDKFSVILESNHQEQLIFKHAISTIVASRSTPAPAPHQAETEA